MGRGYPDFFGYPVHPEYGTLTTKLHATKVVGPGTTFDLLDVSFKGRILGGLLYTFQDAFDDNVQCQATIDNVIVASVNGQGDELYRFGKSDGILLKPLIVDHANLRYWWSIQSDFVVNFSFVLTAINNEAVVDYLAGVTLFYNGYEAP